MRLHLNTFNVDSKALIRLFYYINTLIKKSKLSGVFTFITLIDYELGKRYGFTTTYNGALKMNEEFFEYIKLLEWLGIIKKTYSGYIIFNGERKASKYYIDKPLFVIWFSALTLINAFTKKQIELKNKKCFSDSIVSIVNGINKSKTKFKHPEHSSFIDDMYALLDITCRYHYGRFKNKEIVSSYLGKYIVSEAQGNSYKYNIRGEQHPKFKSLTMVWFTNKYFGVIKTDLISQKNTYESYYKTNKLFFPVYNFLDKNLDRIKMFDVEMEPSVFNTVPGSSIESKKEVLCEAIKKYATFECPFIYYVKQCVESLRGYEDNYRMNINVKITNMSNNPDEPYRYKIRISGRMTNDSCSLPTKTREEKRKFKRLRSRVFGRLGINDHFDIMGTVFTISRALNNHTELDLTYDIKQELADLNIYAKYNGTFQVLVRTHFKKLLYYVFFAKDENESWNYYKNRYNASFFKQFEDYDIELFKATKKEIDEEVPILSEAQFKKIYRYVQDSTGGTVEYRNNIFFIESAIEALTMKELLEKGFVIKNVYDGFHFDNTTITEDYIKRTIVKNANEVFENYYKLSQKNGLASSTSDNILCKVAIEQPSSHYTYSW